MPFGVVGELVGIDEVGSDDGLLVKALDDMYGVPDTHGIVLELHVVNFEDIEILLVGSSARAGSAWSAHRP